MSVIATIAGALVVAVSLCADSFAVSICSSISRKADSGKLSWGVALIFGTVQAGFLLIGWAFGDLFAGYLTRVADFIGFVLLAYVGGSMIRESVKEDGQVYVLSGIRNVLVAAVAVSIDAFAVGLSLSLTGNAGPVIALYTVAVFFVTVLSVAVGTEFGRKIGRRFGAGAELAGGIILVLIAIGILFGLF